MNLCDCLHLDVHHYPNIISLLFSSGSSLVFITLSTVLNGTPAPRSSSSASSQPMLDAFVGLEEHNGVLQDAEDAAMPGLVESSQESSGFFSEDSEENKSPLALRKWVQAELNSSLDADSLIGM